MLIVSQFESVDYADIDASICLKAACLLLSESSAFVAPYSLSISYAIGIPLCFAIRSYNLVCCSTCSVVISLAFIFSDPASLA